MDFLTPWLLVGGLFFPLRRLERWLHQHLFKVGWLLTHRLRATTALYYTFFLPGVLLHEVVRWLVAGFLNVQSERAIQWPEAQDVGELRLNFIRLSRDASDVKRAMISTAPFIAGVVVVYLITNNILNMSMFVEALLTGGLDRVPDTLAAMTQTPDFLLWVYITFTIANTMLPDFRELKGWGLVLVIVGLAVAGLFAIGAGDEVFLTNLAEPIDNGLRGLAGVFVAVIAINLFMVAVLGTVEAVIERVTGHSATFKNGKLLTMTREQAQALKEQERARREKQLARRSQRESGPPSVYKLPLPIPDPPDLSRMAPDPITVKAETPSPLPAGQTAPPRPAIFTRGVSTPATPTTTSAEDDNAPVDETDALTDEKTQPEPVTLPKVSDASDDSEDDDADFDGITREPPEEPA